MPIVRNCNLIYHQQIHACPRSLRRPPSLASLSRSMSWAQPASRRAGGGGEEHEKVRGRGARVGDLPYRTVTPPRRTSDAREPLRRIQRGAGARNARLGSPSPCASPASCVEVLVRNPDRARRTACETHACGVRACSTRLLRRRGAQRVRSGRRRARQATEPIRCYLRGVPHRVARREARQRRRANGIPQL